MAYDDQLAERVRQLLPGDRTFSEQAMFGGLAFLVGGHMAVVVSGKGGLMVRTDHDVAQACVAKGSARFAEMRGRNLRGWLRIDPDGLKTDQNLARWVELGTNFATALPPKH
ncbi:MAG: TfoX/Sxy family protein [Acidimicrobiia bacterium]|nr:TfoX/Sxy family protein [Acidimicrobiia bacterium]NNC44135.1 TfoX/Sxy family protein [Acidimicrobiia bacterium]NND12977.1 TfoX/Sxy family protein [Acidimicrobiia bacterium]NNL27895.1 TfoX/Sxy family protein [Acidimicrobiia bacterium]NNL46887.1 TfoX/Sxy family protein [Acidimicrobiia bacterium]